MEHFRFPQKEWILLDTGARLQDQKIGGPQKSLDF